jgi:hypothetical protein
MRERPFYFIQLDWLERKRTRTKYEQSSRTTAASDIKSNLALIILLPNLRQLENQKKL